MGYTNGAYRVGLVLCICAVWIVLPAVGASFEDTERGQQNSTDTMATEEVFSQYTANDVAFEKTDEPTESIEQTMQTEKEKADNDKNMHDNDDDEERLPFEVRFFRGLTGAVVLTIYTGLVGFSLLRLLGNYSEKFRLLS